MISKQVKIIEINKNILKELKLEEYRENRRQYQIAEKLSKLSVNQDFDSYKDNPEYILLEEERQNNIKNIVRCIMEELTDTEKEYLNAYADNNMNYNKTGRYLGVDHKAVMYYMKKIKYKALLTIKKLGLTEDDLKEIFTPCNPVHNGGFGSKVGYLFELYMHLPDRGCWDGRYGSQMASTKKKLVCKIPEYVNDCGLNCVCSICSENWKCTRTDMFPCNKRPTEAINKNKAIIAECLNNIHTWMEGQDFSKLERVERLSC